jgi:ATP-dependent Lon protease
MMENKAMEIPERDALDDKINRIFSGKVVRKDLVRKIKVGANVPVFVLEFLLGKYCASSDEMAIQMGLKVVNKTLTDNYIGPDESTRAKSMVKEEGIHTFIDKVRVRIVDSDYWAEVVNFGDRFVHIPTHYVREYDRLLMGGVWAQVDLRFEYDEESKGKRPFKIDKLAPIQIATFDMDDYSRLRAEFSSEEWVDLLIRSMGYESEAMSRRLKLHFLLRLIPLCERNYNLVELGPRGTGKSFAIQEISPYGALLTGPTTVANMFGHMSGRHKGMVSTWDVVGFDEVADLQKMPKEVIITLKTYCESGTFQRGKDADSGNAGIVMFGNTNQPIDVMVQTGHLFAPMPDVIRDDMAFIDRLHFYLPGWEIPKMRVELFTKHYGFVVDYLAEALRSLRKFNYTEVIDRHFSLGAHLNARDRKAVRKTVSVLMKIMYPNGEATPDELKEILALALEGRRRVKEQLKKMAGGVTGLTKESIQRAYGYLNAKKGELGFAREMDNSDFHVEVLDLLNNKVEGDLGVAFFVAIFSAIRKNPVTAATLILGDMSIQGNIKPVRSLVEPLQIAKDNGAKRALIPIENKRNFLDVDADIMEHVDPVFYGEPRAAAMKALALT